MLQRSNGLIWYSARCRLLFWYARQSVLMEDDCSRVWRQFDGLWMRAHSVPLTAQDNALCSLSPPTLTPYPHHPISHNLTYTHKPYRTGQRHTTSGSTTLLCVLPPAQRKAAPLSNKLCFFRVFFFVCVCVVSLHLMQPRSFRLSRQFGFLFHCCRLFFSLSPRNHRI